MPAIDDATTGSRCPKAAAWLGWTLCGVSALAVPATVILAQSSGPGARPEQAPSHPFVGLVFVTFAIFGALVVSRQPRNAAGWIMSAAGIGGSLNNLTSEYASYALLVEPGALPAGEAMLWLSEWIWITAIPLSTFLLLLYPGGRLPSRRWRPVGWLAGVGIAGVFLNEAFTPGEFEFIPRDNPLGLGGAGGEVAKALAFSFVLVLVAAVASVVSLVVRLRRSRGEERQQLKWLTGGAVALLLGVLVADLPVVEILLPIFIGQMVFAVAVGIGILKYRLYEIDVLINRALVYGALSATLAGAYLVAVILVQLALSPLTESSNLSIAVSTLAVAALFQPARRRTQAAVDRRFYRRKYDAAQTLERFGARLRDEVALDTLSDDLRAVVTETMQPSHVSLWLRDQQADR